MDNHTQFEDTRNSISSYEVYRIEATSSVLGMARNFLAEAKGDESTGPGQVAGVSRNGLIRVAVGLS